MQVDTGSSVGLDRLRVVTKMGSLSESSSKRSTRSEYIDMTFETMRAYLATRRDF